MTYLLFIITGLLVVWLGLRLRRQQADPKAKSHKHSSAKSGTPTKAGGSKTPEPSKAAAKTRYHCVSVACGKGACNLAKQMSDQRFLPAETPTLPLPGCTAMNCQCRFNHHDDRRHGSRRNPYGEHNAATLAAVDRPVRSRVDRRRSKSQLA